MGGHHTPLACLCISSSTPVPSPPLPALHPSPPPRLCTRSYAFSPGLTGRRSLSAGGCTASALVGCACIPGRAGSGSVSWPCSCGCSAEHALEQMKRTAHWEDSWMAAGAASQAAHAKAAVPTAQPATSCHLPAHTPAISARAAATAWAAFSGRKASRRCTKPWALPEGWAVSGTASSEGEPPCSAS